MARSISVGCQRVGTSSFGLNLGRRAFMGALSAPALAHASSWGEFLGNGSLSLGGETAVPLAWGDQQNLAWRAQTPGYGQSAPVVAGSKAFVTGVEGPNKETLLVSAIDTESGAVAWSHHSASSQRIEDSNMVSKAAPTGITYDDSIFTFFETGNILALNQDGTLRWERSLTEEFGEFGGRHGIGSSLRRCRAGILALVAHDRPSYLICLDPEDGTTVWKADRPEGVSWSTPTVVEHDGNELALVSAGDTVEAYDTSNGASLWTLDGLEGAFIASPTPVPGGAVIGSSAKGHTVAIRFGDSANTPPAIAWRADEASSYFSSPLVHEGHVYMVNKAGVAFCLKADSGEGIWHMRLEGQCWASPIGCSDRVYFFGVDGVTQVVRTGGQFETLAKSSLSVEGRLYGTAVVDNGLLLRYGRDLVKVQQA